MHIAYKSIGVPFASWANEYIGFASIIKKKRMRSENESEEGVSKAYIDPKQCDLFMGRLRS